ncbi:hypothetical protein [Mesonia aestuariivivens]|uniref:Lipoprotein n=1 Tax=Mesonia aestuariivivens TaxID=2796128 RepID=A0ABS6VZC0_9FLAO|nr:hypothetical protein [Mesonia aestuariivivens]MBW2960611.1 hypothetical protein [Mesonia aestuariivivens]
MKGLKFLTLAFAISVSLISCREEKSEDTNEVEGVEMEENANIDVSDDGEKIKMEDSEKEVKIKKDENGNVEKKKVDYKD